ncbi:MAG: RIP metalloprotease RseP [Candidatus Marinimicrobia bacterium]|nr:RIP metalloprotease RseP [Candidatus Neomarinimicrobiota bacterium]|tara:strand:- start:10293 stop:11468 length:1176 start_codon:yes stop_codon:yes gene_type:complete
MTTILAMIFVLGILIFVHELGHFMAARSIGVRVERFSLGYPPRFISFTPTPEGLLFKLFFYRWGESRKPVWGPIVEKLISAPRLKASNTEYCLAIIPLGGYVKVAGYVDESLDVEITGDPDELNSKNRLQQIWFMSAGVIMNILLAVIFFAGITKYSGIPERTGEPVVMDVSPGFPAAEAGIEPGDRVVSVQSKRINEWGDLTEIIHASPNEEINVVWMRDGQTQSALMKTRVGPIPDGDSIKEVGLIGVAGGYTIRQATIGESIVNGMERTGYWYGMIVRSLSMIVKGEASMKDIGGPILIAQLAGESARAGMIALLSFTAIISVNLAFINILPIPGLDGGHILIVTLEGIARRHFSLKVRMAIQQAGMALLLLLIIVVLYNDLTRLFTN